MTEQVIETDKLIAKALVWLGKQEYSVAKFTQKLVQQQATPSQIEQLVELFCQRGWLNELRYCQGFVRGRVAKGQGETRILHDGRAKQLDSELLNQAVQQAEIDWFELAADTYQRRYANNDLLKQADRQAAFKERNKRMRFMQYRGFSFEQIEYAIDCLDEQS